MASERMESERYRDAYEGRVGADRMALGLSIIPNPVRGDMDEVKRLKAENERLRTLNLECSRLASEAAVELARHQPASGGEG